MYCDRSVNGSPPGSRLKKQHSIQAFDLLAKFLIAFRARYSAVLFGSKKDALAGYDASKAICGAPKQTTQSQGQTYPFQSIDS
jgi:hypothetical protein